MANYVPTKCVFRSSKKEFFEQWQKDKELIDENVYSYLDENAHDLFEKYQIEDSSFTWESDCKLPSESVIRTENEYMEAELWYSGVWIPAPQAAYCLADALAQKAGIKKTDVQVIITIIMFEMCFVMTTDPAFKGKVLTKLDCSDIPMFDDICAKGPDDYWVSTILDTNQFVEPSEMLKKIKKIIKDNKLEGYEDLGKNFKYSPNYETETVLFGGVPNENILELLDFESRYNSNNKNSIGIYFLVFTEELPSSSPAHYDTFKRLVSIANEVTSISFDEAIDCLKTLKPGEHTLHIYGDVGELYALDKDSVTIPDNVILNLDLYNVRNASWVVINDLTRYKKIKSLILPYDLDEINICLLDELPFIETLTISANLCQINFEDIEYYPKNKKEYHYYIPTDDPTDVHGYGIDVENLFQQNKNLKEIIVDENNEYFCAEDGVLYNKDKTELIACSPAKSGKLFVPDSVKIIHNAAFAHCKKLKEIVLPEGLEIIEHHAFILCTSLKTINIPESVKEIGLLSFSGCKKLTSIVIPENVKLKDCYPACDGQDLYESNALFYDCESLVSAEIKTNISKIDFKMFSKCINLINVAIPNSVTLIEAHAFDECTSLRQIIIPNSVTEIDDCAFYGCSSLDEIVYAGTIKECNQIEFDESVFEGVPAKVIKCKDGEVEIEQEDDDE